MLTPEPVTLGDGTLLGNITEVGPYARDTRFTTSQVFKPFRYQVEALSATRAIAVIYGAHYPQAWATYATAKGLTNNYQENHAWTVRILLLAVSGGGVTGVLDTYDITDFETSDEVLDDNDGQPRRPVLLARINDSTMGMAYTTLDQITTGTFSTWKGHLETRVISVSGDVISVTASATLSESSHNGENDRTIFSICKYSETEYMVTHWTDYGLTNSEEKWNYSIFDSGAVLQQSGEAFRLIYGSRLWYKAHSAQLGDGRAITISYAYQQGDDALRAADHSWHTESVAVIENGVVAFTGRLEEIDTTDNGLSPNHCSLDVVGCVQVGENVVLLAAQYEQEMTSSGFSVDSFTKLTHAIPLSWNGVALVWGKATGRVEDSKVEVWKDSGGEGRADYWHELRAWCTPGSLDIAYLSGQWPADGDTMGYILTEPSAGGTVSHKGQDSDWKAARVEDQALWLPTAGFDETLLTPFAPRYAVLSNRFSSSVDDIFRFVVTAPTPAPPVVITNLVGRQQGQFVRFQ